MSNDETKLGHSDDLLNARRLVELRNLQDAKNIAHSMLDDEHKVSAYEQIIANLIVAQALEEAEQVVEAMPDSYEKAAAFRQIAERRLSSNQIREAINLLEKAKQVPRQLDIAWEMGEALNRVALALYKVGDTAQAHYFQSEAIEFARAGEESDNLQNSIDASSVLWEISENLALAGHWQTAKQVAEGIKHPIKRSRAIQSLARIESGGKGSWER